MFDKIQFKVNISSAISQRKHLSQGIKENEVLANLFDLCAAYRQQ